MSLIGVTKFEHLFRAAGGIDIDRQDLKRYTEFVAHKINDFVVRAEATAKANGRDIIQAFDLPITKGLQESIQAFRRIDEHGELLQLLEKVTPLPPTDLAYSEEAEARLPAIAGGLSLALARSFKILDPTLKNPASEHWERAYQMFDTLL